MVCREEDQISGYCTIDGKETYLDFCLSNQFNIEYVKIPKTLSCICDNCFSFMANLVSVEIPENIQEIGDYAFSNCQSLENINIKSNTIEIIPQGCFENNRLLNHITLPDKIKRIKSKAFYGCEKISSILFSNNLEEIGYGAFCFCNQLSNIVIPKNINIIEKYAFYFCEKIKCIKFENQNDFQINNNSFNFNIIEKILAKPNFLLKIKDYINPIKHKKNGEKVNGNAINCVLAIEVQNKPTDVVYYTSDNSSYLVAPYARILIRHKK